MVCHCFGGFRIDSEAAASASYFRVALLLARIVRRAFVCAHLYDGGPCGGGLSYALIKVEIRI